MKIRKANERGHFNNNWLNSWHSFSFSSYHDPKHMNFSLLRVLNDDIVAPYQGFGLHPHKDMEIITFMLSGSIEHKDNLGNKHILEAGNVQLMRAGTGIAHSEINPSSIPAHLLQIWIFSEEDKLTPGWWEKSFTEKRNSILVEPIHKNHQILKLNDSLVGNGLKIAQQAYVLSIYDKTTLHIEDFGTSDVYIHIPTHKAVVHEGDKIWNLESGDALFEENFTSSIDIEPFNEPVLVFIFPK